MLKQVKAYAGLVVFMLAVLLPPVALVVMFINFIAGVCVLFLFGALLGGSNHLMKEWSEEQDEIAYKAYMTREKEKGDIAHAKYLAEHEALWGRSIR